MPVARRMMAASAAGGLGGHLILFAGAFDGAASMSRTFTSSATHSGSVWLKRSSIGSTQNIFGTTIYFNSSDQLVINGLTSTTKYEDIVAPYHLFWNNTGAYINGTLVTGTGTYATSALTNPVVGGPTNLFDGLMAEFGFGDGQNWSLAATGAFSTTTPTEWTPKNIIGQSFGTEGHLLQFADSDALGDDTSGNAKDWTNSGVAQDRDTPTDTGLTLNPLDVLDDENATYSNNNKTIAFSSTSDAHIGSTMALPHTGTFHIEFEPDVLGGTGSGSGILIYSDNASTASTNLLAFATGDTLNADWQTADGAMSHGSYAVGQRCSIEIDIDADTFKVVIDGTTTVTNTSVGYNTGAGERNFIRWWHSGGSGRSDTTTIYPTSGGWTETVTDGYVALSTANLPEPATAASVTPITSPSFTGNINADGPFINLGYAPDQAGTSTINGNTIIWGTHAIASATGFKIITASTSYNSTGTNTISIAVKAPFKYANGQVTG